MHDSIILGIVIVIYSSYLYFTHSPPPLIITQSNYLLLLLDLITHTYRQKTEKNEEKKRKDNIQYGTVLDYQILLY